MTTLKVSELLGIMSDVYDEQAAEGMALASTCDCDDTRRMLVGQTKMLLASAKAYNRAATIARIREQQESTALKAAQLTERQADAQLPPSNREEG